ncbi:hypothetical protein PVAP13_6KG217906 [Panicum virgatum]|uniref:Uncharacterized protein n=1 Tax=Panicum virgatum TaxID=38727 RepID=A0A8T0RAS2_PANVG|nr:hypothetical protein PVAP13_6KG217906 [Panicum virgatum]
MDSTGDDLPPHLGGVPLSSHRPFQPRAPPRTARRLWPSIRAGACPTWALARPPEAQASRGVRETAQDRH